MSNKKSIHGTTLALALAACAAMPAAAQQTPWYGGLSVGQSKTDHEFVTNREGAISNATNIRTDFDDKDGAWKGFVGYRVTPWLALEVNYADYGSVRSDTRFDVPGGLNGFGSVTVDRDVKGFGIDGLVSAPVGDRFSVFGRVGAFRAETRASARIAGDSFFTDGTPGTERSNKSSETVVKYGVGLDWNLTPQIAARLEYERLDRVGKKFESGTSGTTGEAAVDTLMIGALFRF